MPTLTATPAKPVLSRTSVIGSGTVLTAGTLCYLGYALGLSGRRKEEQAILDKLKTTKEYVSPTELATLHVTLGDKEEGLAMLEKAYAARDLQLQCLKVDWHFDGLRSDPRFQDLMRRVGLPQ